MDRIESILVPGK